MKKYKVGDKVRTKGGYKHTIKKFLGMDKVEYEVVENKWIWQTQNIVHPIISVITSDIFGEFLTEKVAWLITSTTDLTSAINILSKEGIYVLDKNNKPFNKSICLYYDGRGRVSSGSFDELQNKGYEIIELENPIARYKKPLYRPGDNVFYDKKIVVVQRINPHFNGNGYDIGGERFQGINVAEEDLISLYPVPAHRDCKTMYKGYDAEEMWEFYRKYEKYDLDKMIAFYNKYKDLAAAIEKLNKPE